MNKNLIINFTKQTIPLLDNDDLLDLSSGFASNIDCDFDDESCCRDFGKNYQNSKYLPLEYINTIYQYKFRPIYLVIELIKQKNYTKIEIYQKGPRLYCWVNDILLTKEVYLVK